MSWNTLLEDGDLRVRLEVDEVYGDIRDNQDGLPHEVRVFDPYAGWNSYGQRPEDRRIGGPLYGEWAYLLRRNWWRDDPGDWATKVFRRYVQMAGGVTDMDGDRIFYLLPEDAGGITDRDVLGKQLEGGIKEIRAWENGEVYGYVIERKVEWVRVDAPLDGGRLTTWETEDSCWGIVGYEWAEQEAREAFGYAKDVN